MKFGKMLLVALLCGLFLLLLSALVVTPETETVLPENLPLTGLEMSACALPVWADAGDSASRWFWMLAALFFCAPLCLLPRLVLKNCHEKVLLAPLDRPCSRNIGILCGEEGSSSLSVKKFVLFLKNWNFEQYQR